MSNLTSNVLKIIISYVDSDNLINFFCKYKLDNKSKFNYDLYYYELTINQINSLITYFPNIIFNKLCIVYETNIFFDTLLFTLKKVKHLKIIGKGRIYTKQKIPNLYDCFDNFPNVESINISYVRLLSLDSIKQCTKLRSIKISMCAWSSNALIYMFPKLLDLRTVILLQCNITPYDADILLKCNELKKLSISNTWPINKPFIFKHLTHLIISNNHKVPKTTVLKLSMFNKCLNLRYLNLFYCGTLIDASDITFPLKVIKVKCLEEELIKMRRLKTLRKLYFYKNIKY